MSDKEKLNFEAESVTPVIKDFENLVLRISKLIVYLIKWIIKGVGQVLDESLRSWKIMIGVFVLALVATAASFIVMPQNYSSSMIIESQFESQNQLYSDISYLSSLVQNRKHEELANILKLDIKDVALIKGFSIEPVGDHFDKVKLVAEKTFRRDTTSLKYLNREELLQDQSIELYSKHNITINSAESGVFKNLEPGLMQFLESDEKLQTKRKVEIAVLKSREIAIQGLLAELDSLQATTREAMVLNAQKSGSGMNISMGEDDSKSRYDPVKLFRLAEAYQQNLEEITSSLAKCQSVYLTVSHLHKEGAKDFFNFNRRAYILGSFFYLLSIGILLRRRYNA